MDEEGWARARKSRDFEFEYGRDDGTLLQESEKEDSDDEDEKEGEGSYERGGMKSTLWVILSTTATLVGRRMLRNGFPHPFYLMLLMQLGAYVAVAVVVLVVRLGNIRAAPKRKKPRDEQHTLKECGLIGFRIFTSNSIAGVGMLLGAQALMEFSNLSILAMLPISTYVFDSFVFRLGNALRLIPRDQNLSLWGLYRVVLVIGCIAFALNEDYRLDREALKKTLASFALFSVSKLFSRIGPRINKGSQSWETVLQLYLLAGIPPLVLAGYATSKYEDVPAASHMAESWGTAYRILNFLPGVVLHILYNSSMLSAYPFTSQEHIGGGLEDSSPMATDAIASTMQAGLWVVVVGVSGNERNFLNWIQIIAFTIIYVICVGPRHIGYYPPRALNLVLRILRRRPLKIRKEPWQYAFFLLSTTIIFAALISTNTIFWIDNLAYKKDLSSWLGPKSLFLDTTYRPPELRSFDIVIAHSAGDPIDSIADLIYTVAKLPHFAGLTRVKIYTQDPGFPMTDGTVTELRGDFEGAITVQTIRNVGGVSAAYLHHILYSWEFLPVHTLFLYTRTATSSNIQTIVNRLVQYYIPPDFPVPDALPKTGFLNLGEMETCYCGDCFDSTGWSDTFNLIPSMWSAARPGSMTCKSVLLTHGNNFFASAARIRGVKKDVWQVLYDALVNQDLNNAWAHAREKLPVMLTSEEGQGSFASGEIYGEPDSLERPYLGFTIERLWGVLLQCSSGEIAWRCPTMEIGVRRGGDRHDCGCID